MLGLMIVSSVYATQSGDPGDATARGFNEQGTPAESDDMVINLGVYDGVNWVRSTPEMMGGSITTESNINQEALSNTSEAIPATPMADRTVLCVFNQDIGINVFCKDTVTATVTNGRMIEPRTERCFKATEVINCIAASGTPTIDYEER